MNMYVSNLSHSVTEQELKELFTPYGMVESVYVIKDKHTGMPKGAAYVMMPSDVEAEQAIAGLDGTEHDGQTVHVARADSADFPTGDYW
ncbi:RNA-binding protein [Candidatus Dependentiae bacterium]|nr:MAG: RNA-binding protein [Candidatus Dependentiae bacterium]